MDINPNNVNDIDITKPVAEQVVPIYDEHGKLTREGMERVIKDGGSVMLGHRLVTRVDDLPSEAQLAQGDAVRAKAAAERIQAQIAALQADLAMVSADDAARKANQHPAYLPFPTMSDQEPGGGMVRGGLGTGDTAGLDGDASVEGTAAHAALEPERKAADERAKADEEAAAARAKAEEARKAAQEKIEAARARVAAQASTPKKDDK